jgi:sugar/nucleoside kinase (ribokinase family)
MWKSPKKVLVTCVGSISKDIFLPTGDAVFMDTPEDTLTPHKVVLPLGGKMLIEDRFEDIGGVAANVSIGLARLGHSVRIVSRVGNDDIAIRILERLKKENVSLDALIQLPTTPSDLSAIIVFTQTGERTILHNRDANEQLVVAERDLENTDWVFLSALNGDWKKNVETILQAKKKYGFRIALNPGQHNLKQDPEFMKALIREADLLTLNHDEAIFLLGGEYAHSDEEAILKAIQTLGPKYVALTDGARGAWAYDGSKMYSIVPPAVEQVKDSTGAGDAFASGFFGAILHEHSVEIAIRWGIANSIAVIQEYGATKALLTETELGSI